MVMTQKKKKTIIELIKKIKKHDHVVFMFVPMLLKLLIEKTKWYCLLCCTMLYSEARDNCKV